MTIIDHEYWARRLPNSAPPINQVIDWNAIKPAPMWSSPSTRKRRITIAEIVNACAAFAIVSVGHLTSSRRPRSLVTPRHAAMYLACTYGHQSLPQIGQAIGGRDHSTVIHARERVAADLASGGKVFGEIVAHVERKLGLK